MASGAHDCGPPGRGRAGHGEDEGKQEAPQPEARQRGAVPAEKSAPKPLREAVSRLEATVGELKDHSRRGDRKAAARKAARTRRGKAESRRRAARKGARKRSKS